MDYLWIVISALLVFVGNLFWRRARAGKRGVTPEGLSFFVLICFLLVVIGSVGLFVFTDWLKALGLIIAAFFISALLQK